MRRGVLLTFVVAGALSLGVGEAAAQPLLTVSAGATLPTVTTANTRTPDTWSLQA